MKKLATWAFVIFLCLLPASAQAADWTKESATVLDIPREIQLPLYDKPNGKIIKNGKYSFFVTGKYWVAKRAGKWLGVYSWASKNNRLVWINKDDANTFASFFVTWKKVVVDRSRKTLWVYNKGKVIFKTRVSIGKKSAPTPLGKTSVEDVYKPASQGLPTAYYGAWILALGMWQNAKTPGFPQGGAVAFHGTPEPADIGKARSAGCLRLRHADLKKLKTLLSAGTPVWIKR